MLCLVCSIILNIFFLFKVGGEWNLSWSKTAATEAEAVAAISCSGHGRAYLDGLVLDGNKGPVCECNACYGGPDCSQFFPDCSADANGYLTPPLALSATHSYIHPKMKTFLGQVWELVLNRFQIYTFTCDKTRFGLKLLIKYFDFMISHILSLLFRFSFFSTFFFNFSFRIIEKPR